MIDAAAVGNHHRGHQATVLSSPPAACPVAAPLLLKCPITEKRDQTLPRQRHVGVLQFSEAQISALDQPAGSVGVDVTAQGNPRCAIRSDGVAVKVTHQPGQPRLVERVPSLLFWMQIAEQYVDAFDSRHTVPLPHQPATGQPRQRVGGRVAKIGRHHVQRTTGMPLRIFLEVIRRQRLSGQVHSAGIGHVGYQPHGRVGEGVCSLENNQGIVERVITPGTHEFLAQVEHAHLGQIGMFDHPAPFCPVGKLGVTLPVLDSTLLDSM